MYVVLVCMYVCIYVSMYLSMYICVPVYIYVCVLTDLNGLESFHYCTRILMHFNIII
jgi:hypothetical protein